MEIMKQEEDDWDMSYLSIAAFSSFIIIIYYYHSLLSFIIILHYCHPSSSHLSIKDIPTTNFTIIFHLNHIYSFLIHFFLLPFLIIIFLIFII